MAFLVNLGHAMQAYSVPCWWVSWWLWGAGCISQDTYLLYKLLLTSLNYFKVSNAVACLLVYLNLQQILKQELL